MAGRGRWFPGVLPGPSTPPRRPPGRAGTAGGRVGFIAGQLPPAQRHIAGGAPRTGGPSRSAATGSPPGGRRSGPGGRSRWRTPPCRGPAGGLPLTGPCPAAVLSVPSRPLPLVPFMRKGEWFVSGGQDEPATRAISACRGNPSPPARSRPASARARRSREGPCAPGSRGCAVQGPGCGPVPGVRGSPASEVASVLRWLEVGRVRREGGWARRRRWAFGRDPRCSTQPPGPGPARGQRQEPLRHPRGAPRPSHR